MSIRVRNMLVRLDRNERSIKLPREITDPIKESIKFLNRYTPQSKVDELLSLLSTYTNSPKNSIIISTASDILLKEFIYLFSKNRQIILADPSFFLINATCRKTYSSILKVRLKEPEFKFSIVPLIDELKKPTLIILDNPNNPTGNIILDKNEVKLILENENIIFLVDEAYFEFSNISYVNLIADYPNLAILRTLSKGFGLSGLGVGYIIGGKTVQKMFIGINTMLPYPNVVAGISALKNKNYAIEYIKEVEKEKNRIRSVASKLDISVFKSYSNFLLMKTKIPNISKKLAEQGVLVLDVSKQLGSEYFRVTIGTKKENDYFLGALEKITYQNRD